MESLIKSEPQHQEDVALEDQVGAMLLHQRMAEVKEVPIHSRIENTQCKVCRRFLSFGPKINRPSFCTMECFVQFETKHAIKLSNVESEKVEAAILNNPGKRIIIKFNKYPGGERDTFQDICVVENEAVIPDDLLERSVAGSRASSRRRSSRGRFAPPVGRGGRGFDFNRPQEQRGQVADRLGHQQQPQYYWQGAARPLMNFDGEEHLRRRERQYYNWQNFPRSPHYFHGV